jgi:uncharacterized protein (DUF2249 family)
MIAPDVTIGQLLDKHPQLLPVLVEFHPHFKRLGNRLLRNVMAPRVSLAQAARIAGIPLEDLLTALRRAVGESDVANPAPARAADEPVSAPKPAALMGLGEDQIVHLDVREDIRRGVEPFARIMAAVKSLGDGQALVLQTPFEPIPLYDVLGKRGLHHWSEAEGLTDWSVWFYRDAAHTAREAGERPAPGATGSPTALDVRGLEPPLPMVRVLERADALSVAEELEVVHDRRPLFLYPQLEERGFVHETDEPEPGVIRIRIRRAERP